MYKAFYNLNEMPFDQSVDPKFTWLGNKHSAALLSIKKDFLDKKGLFLITGDAGTGKTSFVKRFLAEIDSDKIVVTVTDPDLDELDFFNWLSIEFNINVIFKSKGAFLTRFKRFLLDTYQKKVKIILIIDDAHRVNQELLDAIMILANIEKDGEKLLSIFFIGQSGFNDILQETHNLVLRQSIKTKYHLEPLQKDEVVELILYRLKVAGAKAEIFSSNAYEEIYLFSAGYPRMVVNICDRALIAGCVRSIHIINKELIIECGKDLQIAGIKRKIEGSNYQDSNYYIGVSEENADGETEAEANYFSTGGLSTRIVSILRTSIFPAILVFIIVVGIYLLYYFKPAFLSWASLNLAQEKSASLLGQQSATTDEQINQNASGKDLAFSPNENEKSINTRERQTEFTDDKHQRADLDPDENNMLPDHANAPLADESLDTPSGVDDFPRVSENKESLPVKSNTGTLGISASREKVSEAISEGSVANIDQLPPALSEIESEKKSTEGEFESLPRRLALKLKPLEKEWQDAEIKLARLEPETKKISLARPADDSKARRDDQLSYLVATRLRPLENERQDADIKTVRLEPGAGNADVALPARDPKANNDVQSSRSTTTKLALLEKEQVDTGLKIVQIEPETEKVPAEQPEHDTEIPNDIQPLQPVVEKPPIQAPPVKSDLDPINKPQQKPGIEIADLGQTAGKEDFSSRPKLKERVQSFLDVYCQTYEAKDLDHFATFFTADAEENDKPFHSLLPQYRRNFNAIEFISYRIELQNYKYDEKNETVKIEGKFFLEWLPDGAEWRRNSGKIFMELLDSGSSYKISRLDYYGDRTKRTMRTSN